MTPLPTKRFPSPIELAQMSDAQALTHLLTLSGLSRTHSLSLAHSLLDTHQSLKHILALPQDALLEHPGLGEKAATFLILLSGLIGRYSGQHARPLPRLTTLTQLKELLLPHFSGQSVERVYALCLSERQEILSGGLTAQGGSMTVFCSLSRVLQLALTHNASAVILAHNHPDNTPIFSRPDLEATTKIAYKLNQAGVFLADHYLLAGTQLISLRSLKPCAEHPYDLGKFPTWFSLCQ